MISLFPRDLLQLRVKRRRIAAEKLGDGARVPDRPDGYLIHGAVGDGQPVGHDGQLTDQFDPSRFRHCGEVTSTAVGPWNVEPIE